MRVEIARGAAWMVLFRLLDRSIGVVSTTLLARLLVPADFGLVAMAMSVIALIELATAFSFEIALIQKPDPRREHYDTAWTLNIIVAAGCALLTAALAQPVAAFYGDARLVPIMFAIGAAWLVSGFENVGVANFRRNMNFAGEFRMLAAKRALGFVVTILAALWLHSYWALIIGTATSRLAGLALSYLMQPFRPRLSLACARELFSFSGWLLLNNLVGVLIGRAPHFVVGRLFGAQSLGVYTVGSEIANLAHTELVAPINRAMFPGYSRLAGDLPTFRSMCVDTTAAILLVVLPVSVGVAVLADPLVRVLLGAQWHDAVPVIRILAFAGAVSAMTSNHISAYLALARPHLSTLIQVSRAALLGAGVVAFASRGGAATAIAYAELLAAVGSLAVSLPILFATVKLPARQYFSSLWRPAFASATMGAVLLSVTSALVGEESFSRALLTLLVCTPIGAAAYLALLAALWFVAGRPSTVEAQIAARAYGVIATRFGLARP